MTLMVASNTFRLCLEGEGKEGLGGGDIEEIFHIF